MFSWVQDGETLPCDPFTPGTAAINIDASVRFWPVRPRSCTGAIANQRLNLGLLSNLQDVIDLVAPIPDRALQLRVTQQ